MSIFQIDESSGIPVWIQLRNRFIYLIESGHYAKGDQLPTVRALAADLGINYHTINKVYISLEHEGYAASKRGKGTFVSERTGDAEEKAATTAILEECIRRCLELGMSAEDIRHQFPSILDQVEADRSENTATRSS